jgi:hypothetical protein
MSYRIVIETEVPTGAAGGSKIIVLPDVSNESVDI